MEQDTRRRAGRNPPRISSGLNVARVSDYFCQVRFLWRLARSFLRRLCLLIFALRRFFSEPIDLMSGPRSIYDLVQRILNDSFSPGSLELRD